MAALKPAGILVSVANCSLMTPEIDAAVAAGIPVITIDSDAPASHRLYFIGTNNLEAGRLGGARVAAQLNGKGNVVFFTIAGQPNLEERLKGYKDVFASYPGIKIVDVFDMKGDSGVAMDKAQEYLAKTGTGQDRRDDLPRGLGRQGCRRSLSSGPNATGRAAGCDGRGRRHPATGQGWNHRLHHLAEALHHGACSG